MFEMAMHTMKDSELNTWDTVRYVVFDSLQSREDTNEYEKRVAQVYAIDENPFIVSKNSNDEEKAKNPANNVILHW